MPFPFKICFNTYFGGAAEKDKNEKKSEVFIGMDRKCKANFNIQLSLQD